MAVRLLYLITVRILSWLASLCRSKKELITEVSTAAARGRGCTDHETGERDRRPPNGAPWGGGLRAPGRDRGAEVGGDAQIGARGPGSLDGGLTVIRSAASRSTGSAGMCSSNVPAGSTTSGSAAATPAPASWCWSATCTSAS
jgi:hypothetical protein